MLCLLRRPPLSRSGGAEVGRGSRRRPCWAHPSSVLLLRQTGEGCPALGPVPRGGYACGCIVASPAELAAIADQFMVRRDIAFLNHGSYGACPRPVFEIVSVVAARVGEPTRRIPSVGACVGCSAEARAALGDFLGTDADNVVYTPNVTVGDQCRRPLDGPQARRRNPRHRSASMAPSIARGVLLRQERRPLYQPADLRCRSRQPSGSWRNCGRA